MRPPPPPPSLPSPALTRQWFVSVTFRAPEDVCSTATSPLPLGDRLVLNANTIAEEIPLTPQEASAAGWVAGSCFSGEDDQRVFPCVHVCS